jgi:outer membrane lipoprotein LolB
MRTVAAALACAALAAGCATPPPAPPERSYSGRFAATAARGAERQSVSGRFSVVVQGTRQVIELATPIGTTVARVEIAPGRATATGPSLETVSGADADALVQQVLGWRLPVTGLADWLDGRPDPARPSRWQNEGTEPQFVQDGWIITIEERSGAGERPRRLRLERPERAPDPEVTVRLIVDEPVT